MTHCVDTHKYGTNVALMNKFWMIVTKRDVIYTDCEKASDEMPQNFKHLKAYKIKSDHLKNQQECNFLRLTVYVVS